MPKHKRDRTFERLERIAREIGPVTVTIPSPPETGDEAWAFEVETPGPDRALVIAASNYHRHVIALVVECELAFPGLDSACALVKGFGGAVFEPGSKVEVPREAYDAPIDRKADAYLIATPAAFGRDLPEGVLLAVALHEHEIDLSGEDLFDEVRTRVPDGLSWL